MQIIAMFGFMKMVLKNSRHNRAFFFVATDSKGDDIKRESQSFIPPLVYLPFIAVLPLVFLFYVAWRLPLGVVKSK